METVLLFRQLRVRLLRCTFDTNISNSTRLGFGRAYVYVQSFKGGIRHFVQRRNHAEHRCRH